MAGLEGKVALITGAGQGLGRAHALELARHGVRVVVNDFGRGLHGEIEDSPAQQVVEEIKELGSDAVADHGDVADWNAAQAMVRRGVDEWGSIDIVVNNAGFMRDKMIFSMTEDEFDSVVRVHLKGHFCVLRHATEHWREVGKEKGEVYGRVINTASEAAIGQSVGQPNYGPAKAGVINLTMNVALAMAKYGVTSNAIAPRARTRMTDGTNAFSAGPDETGWDPLGPDNITPLVAWLASPDAANVSGNLFIAWGKTVRVMNRPLIDAQFQAEKPWTIDSIGDTLRPHFSERRMIMDGYSVDLTSDYWRFGPDGAPTS